MLTVVVLINELLLVDGLAADLALLENADALLGELLFTSSTTKCLFACGDEDGD